MSDVSGIPYMGSMGTGNFFAPQFSYNPQMSAGQIQSTYMPEAIQSQNVFNNLYASGGGFGRQTDYYSQLGANYSAAGMSPYGVFSDPGSSSPYRSMPDVWNNGASPFYGGGGSSGLGGNIYDLSSSLFGGATPNRTTSDVWNTGASAFQSPSAGAIDWGGLFGGGGGARQSGYAADPFPGMSMPGGLNSPMTMPQQQPADYGSLFGRGVGGTAADISTPPSAPQPNAGDVGAGMFGGLGGAGATPGAGLDWTKLFGGEAKTDPAPNMNMPGGLNSPLGREQSADFGSRFGDWGKQPSGVRGEIVPEERNTTSNMYTIPAGGSVFGGGGAESQLYGANAGSLGAEGGVSYNPITGTGPQGDTADSLAEQARTRLADLMNKDRPIELKADPESLIGPPDPRDAPDYNPFAGMSVPMPQARPEGADVERPPASIPERPGERQAYEAAPRPSANIPAQIEKAAILKGVNPRLAAAVAGGASYLPPGYTVEAVSGVREGTGQSYHSGGRAADFRIIGPDGAIPHKGADDSGMYTLLARGVKTWVQQNDPGLESRMGYGGAFGTQLGGGGVPDLMHYDLGGSRGRMVPDVQFGNLKPLSAAEQNAMPAYIPALGANQVPLDRAGSGSLPPITVAKPQRFGGEFGGEFGGAGGELPSPGAFQPYEGFGQSHPDFENRTNEQSGRDQLAAMQASSEPLPEVALTPIGRELGLEMLGGGDTSQADAAQQLIAKYGPEALWAAQGQSQFPQGQTQPLGGDDVSRMPYTQQSPIPGASFPVQLYDDPRYGQAEAPPASASSRIQDAFDAFTPTPDLGYQGSYPGFGGTDLNMPAWQASIPADRRTPEVIQAVQDVAQRLRVDPASVAMMVQTETGDTSASLWTPTAHNNRYWGATQMGEATFNEMPGGRLAGMTWDEFKRAPMEQQIRAYGDWVEHYARNSPENAAALIQGGIGSLPPEMQAAIMEGTQFGPNRGGTDPNSTSWVQQLGGGNMDVNTSPGADQASWLSPWTINRMEDVFRQKMAAWPQNTPATGSVQQIFGGAR